MKTLICLLSALVILGIVAVPARADTPSDRDFANRLVAVFQDCQKIKPGMTRADLVNLQLFDEYQGPLGPSNDTSFKPHMTFYYRSCALIEVDIDFEPLDDKSASKQARPTDIITAVSMPRIDARPRR